MPAAGVNTCAISVLAAACANADELAVGHRPGRHLLDDSGRDLRKIQCVSSLCCRDCDTAPPCTW